jgi:hypothetical protein
MACPIIDCSNVCVVSDAGSRKYDQNRLDEVGHLSRSSSPGRRAYSWARAATALMQPWIAEHKPDASLMSIQIKEAANRVERSSEALPLWTWPTSRTVSANVIA